MGTPAHTAEKERNSRNNPPVTFHMSLRAGTSPPASPLPARASSSLSPPLGARRRSPPHGRAEVLPARVRPPQPPARTAPGAPSRVWVSVSLPSKVTFSRSSKQQDPKVLQHWGEEQPDTGPTAPFLEDRPCSSRGLTLTPQAPPGQRAPCVHLLGLPGPPQTSRLKMTQVCYLKALKLRKS